MARRSQAQQEMIDVINSVGEEWPMALLYLTRNGANIKVQAGRQANRKERQLTMAAMYLLFLEENLSGDLHEVATEVADVAGELRDDDNVGEVHRGGSFDGGS
ncbi:hypothetical protein BRC65_07255 [Halobacteriales archaeon QH_2_65_14]|nr:MAG: hypothetical protein BRC65_07255 [Halobacteriales archaeon QH_2_65_14]